MSLIMDSQRSCGQCGERASCVYSYGAGPLYACPAHDPTHQPGWASTTLGCSFTYRTLAGAAVPHTTGHLSVRPPQPDPVGCTCPSMWGAIIPPPPCPVHGQAVSMTVRC